MRTLFTALVSAGLAALLLGATPIRTANPIAMLQPLVGKWNCTSTVGGKTTTYTATYSFVLGGKWVRTVNTSGSYASEDMMTYVNHTWRVVDMEPTGGASILEAPDTGLAHMALQTKYPKPGLNVTYDRRSMRAYTLSFSGAMNGKPEKWKDTCTKS